MRFTKIPLIATLMAVALSLLIVLPGLAQQTSDITDGKGEGGPITVGVFANIADAGLTKMRAGGGNEEGAAIFIPIAPAPATPPNSMGAHAATGETAHLVSDTSSPQDTFFRNTLYVSNNASAFNTVLINVASDAAGTCEAGTDNAQTTVNESQISTPFVTARVRNNRSGTPVDVQLVQSSTTGNFQAFFKVVEDGDTGTYDDDDNNQTPEVEADFTEHGGPTWCADLAAMHHADDDNDPATSASNDDGDADQPDPEINTYTTATSAVYGPVVHSRIARPEATQEIATIFAKHGDRLTVTTSAGSGQVQLVVDGDGPDFSAITPEDNDVMRSTRLTYSFEVRDDDSGLRHDGEAVTSVDGDLTEINPDDDHNLGSEPLSTDPDTEVPANGPAADIDVQVLRNPGNGSGSEVEYDDISASGTWSIAGGRAGVAYSFTASGADKGDDSYLYRLSARDRAGNWNTTDADDGQNSPGNQPYVFRVDNKDPELMVARTGISYNREKDEEKVDRSYIALEFTDGASPDAIGDVDTNNITVVGHTIVGYIHPSTASAINRNQGEPARADFKPTVVTYTPSTPAKDRSAPADVSAARDVVVADTPRTDTQTETLILEGRYLQRTGNQAAITGAGTEEVPAPVAPGGTKPTDCGNTAESDDVILCGRFEQHDADLLLHAAGVTAKAKADDDHQAAADAYAKSFVPGTDIEKNDIPGDPRSRVYIELAEDLASDETPTVQVVGGAVRDLAGNTNDAGSLTGDDNEVQDWIAPRLTVTVTSTAADRPVANEKGSFTVDVTADEDVSRPRIYFVSLVAALNEDKDGYDYTIGAEDTNEGNPLTAQEAENHWNRKYKVDSTDLSVFPNSLVGVIVVTDDDSDNSGATDGWDPDRTGMPLRLAQPTTWTSVTWTTQG